MAAEYLTGEAAVFPGSEGGRPRPLVAEAQSGRSGAGGRSTRTTEGHKDQKEQKEPQTAVPVPPSGDPRRLEAGKSTENPASDAEAGKEAAASKETETGKKPETSKKPEAADRVAATVDKEPGADAVLQGEAHTGAEAERPGGSGRPDAGEIMPDPADKNLGKSGVRYAGTLTGGAGQRPAVTPESEALLRDLGLAGKGKSKGGAAAGVHDSARRDGKEAGPELPDFSVIGDIMVTLTLEVGSREIRVADLLELNEGSVVGLEHDEQAPLDLKANGVLIARGEVVLAGEGYGVRVTQVLSSPSNLDPL